MFGYSPISTLPFSTVSVTTDPPEPPTPEPTIKTVPISLRWVLDSRGNVWMLDSRTLKWQIK